MGSRKYSLNDVEFDLDVRIKVRLGYLLEWEGNPLSKDGINRFILESSQEAVLDHLKQEIMFEHECDDTWYDNFIFEVRNVERINDSDPYEDD